MSSQTPSNHAADCWAIAALLRGDFKQHTILPFVLLRCFVCVLRIIKEGREKLTQATDGLLLLFYNSFERYLSSLGGSNIAVKLLNYLRSFSTDVRDRLQPGFDLTKDMSE